MKWTNLFCRVADRDANTPRFSLIGSKGYLYGFDGYFGGHEELDQIMKILEKNGIPLEVTILRVVFQLMNGSTTFKMAASRFTRVTISSANTDKVLLSWGSKRFVGCSTSSKSSSLADSRTRSWKSNLFKSTWKTQSARLRLTELLSLRMSYPR
jgi:hypothetical protein